MTIKRGLNEVNIFAFPNFARYESSAALLSDNKSSSEELKVYTIDEERLTRIKHTYEFPLLAMQYCFDQAGLQSLDEVDLIVTDFARRPSLFNDGPGYPKLEHDFLKGIIDFPKEKIVYVNHHDAHVAGAFYPSGFQESAVLVIDGMGSSLETQSIYMARQNDFVCLSKGYGWGIGGLYSEVSLALGFEGLNGVDLAGKTMGLAPLGENAPSVNLDSGFAQNGAEINLSSFMSRFPKPEIKNEKIKKITQAEKPTDPYFARLAYETQKLAEDAIIEMAREAKKLTGCKNLCVTGGVGLNSVANGKLRDRKSVV